MTFTIGRYIWTNKAPGLGYPQGPAQVCYPRARAGHCHGVKRCMVSSDTHMTQDTNCLGSSQTRRVGGSIRDGHGPRRVEFLMSQEATRSGMGAAWEHYEQEARKRLPVATEALTLP